MAEVQFIDISIVSNRTSRPPRKEGSSKEGKDQFMVTFNLSSNPKGPWIESFNRTWINAASGHLITIADCQ